VFHVEQLERLPGEQDALLGGRKIEGRYLAGGQKYEGTLALSFADENGELAAGGEEPGSGDERLIELLDGAHGDQAGALGDGLRAGVEDGEIGELEGASHLAQEGRLLAVTLDERELELRSPIPHGKARESGAGAEVEDVKGGIAGKKLAGGEKGLAEVARDHLLGRAQGGEIHVLVPAKKEVEMSLDGREQEGVEFGGGNEGGEKFAEGGGFHG